jgi:hypothetical protein
VLKTKYVSSRAQLSGISTCCVIKPSNFSNRLFVDLHLTGGSANVRCFETWAPVQWAQTQRPYSMLGAMVALYPSQSRRLSPLQSNGSATSSIIAFEKFSPVVATRCAAASHGFAVSAAFTLSSCGDRDRRLRRFPFQCDLLVMPGGARLTSDSNTKRKRPRRVRSRAQFGFR